MTRPATIGIDPGGRATGVVVRYDSRLVWAALLTRSGDADFPDGGYVCEVVDAIFDAERWAPDLADGIPATVALEGLRRPGGHARDRDSHLIDPTGVMGTAMVVGAVLANWPDAVLVAPGGHGSGPLATYPAELVGEREQVGTGRLRHLRSAWDIAITAERLAPAPTPRAPQHPSTPRSAAIGSEPVGATDAARRTR